MPSLKLRPHFPGFGISRQLFLKIPKPRLGKDLASRLLLQVHPKDLGRVSQRNDLAPNPPPKSTPEGSKCLNPGLEELGSEIQYLSRPKIKLGRLKAAQIPIRARENWELEFSLIPPGLIKCSQSIFHPGGFARAKTFRERSPGISLEMSGQPN